jgi:hypothetical protein
MPEGFADARCFASSGEPTLSRCQIFVIVCPLLVLSYFHEPNCSICLRVQHCASLRHTLKSLPQQARSCL